MNELGTRISQESSDSDESAFLFQWLSMTIQRFNVVTLSKEHLLCAHPLKMTFNRSSKFVYCSILEIGF